MGFLVRSRSIYHIYPILYDAAAPYRAGEGLCRVIPTLLEGAGALDLSLRSVLLRPGPPLSYPLDYANVRVLPCLVWVSGATMYHLSYNQYYLSK